MGTPTRAAAIVVVLALVLAACGDPSADVPDPRPTSLGPSAVPR